MRFFSFLRNFSSLQIALAISVLAHASLLTIRFASPETFDRLFTAMPLDVILVNARSTEAPEKPQALAQASLDGGGDVDQPNVRATSPLPYAQVTSLGDQYEERLRSIEAAQDEQMALLALLQKRAAQLPKPSPKKREEMTPQELEQEESLQNLLKTIAEIERRIQEENSRPRKRHVTPATKEVPYALYFASMKDMIEKRGNANFPTYRGKRLYGDLVMGVIINNDGQVLNTEVRRTSGIPALDRQAQAIVSSAGPFGEFSKDIRKTADQLEFTAVFRFTKGGGMSTTLQQ